MVLLFLIGILFLAAATALLVRAISLTRIRIASQVRQIEEYGFSTSDSTEQRDLALLRAAARVGTVAERIGRSVPGTGWRAPVTTQQLRGAGLYTVTPNQFQGYRLMATVAVSVLVLLDAVSGSFSITTLLLAAVAAGLTWFGPAVLVGTRAQRRMDRVDRDLPELIDLLIATIEAGLGFAGSLQLVADRFDGPLGQELRLTLREQNMGLSTERALENLLDRCETPSIRAFVRAISQGESLGVSIGTMLRNLAAETRKRRRQKATEQVQKTPVKMLFPLVLLVFPVLLIVLLYPALHNVLQQLGGG
jgi:Flp pilus assembly protein TadB